MVDPGLRGRIGDAVRRERGRLGLSASELARRSGVSKASVSQLESGQTNPSVETLWALSDALGVPFATLVDPGPGGPTLIRVEDLEPVPAGDNGGYSASLLTASPPGARRDLYLVRAEPGKPHRSQPHQSGTIEHIVLVAGAATAGPADNPRVLRPGDYLTYRGDANHVFEATARHTVAVIVSELR